MVLIEIYTKEFTNIAEA